MRVKTLTFAAATAFTFAATALPAQAATFLPGTPEFSLDPGTGNPLLGTQPVSAGIKRSGLAVGSGFSDSYLFQIGPVTGLPIGTGSGTVQTVSALAGKIHDVILTSVIFNNGVDPAITLTPGSGISQIAAGGGYQFDVAGLGGVAIYSGIVNSLTFNYDVPVGDGAYSGTLSFDPTGAVPEPGTWALVLVGFAGIGFAMRRRPKQNVRVKYAF